MTGRSTTVTEMRAMKRHPLALFAHRGGIAASEFAILLPIMILLLFGTVEVGTAVLVQRKITATTQTAADLVAQATIMDDNDIENLFDAMDAIMAPYDDGTATYVVQSIVTEDGNTEIDWVEISGNDESQAGDEFDLPDGVMLAGSSVIVVRVTYPYTPVFGDLIFLNGAFAMSDVAYLKPRRTDQVIRD
jgi:Flp pilus assembly protein TadG